MKALVLNGSLSAGDPTDTVRRLYLNELNQAGWDADTFVLRDTKIAPCVGCFGCWVKTPGKCLIDDARGTTSPAQPSQAICLSS